MCALTLEHDRRKRIKAQQQRFEEMKRAREADELAGHLRAAAKMCGAVKGRTLDVLNLSPAQEIALLEAYARRLELEARDFLEAWPGQDGKRGARWFRLERAKVLETIAKLMISSAKGDD